MQPVRIGIIGFGRIGAEHSGWISSSSHARVGAVYDPTPARLDLARSRGFVALGSIDALLGDPSVEAVLISTPTAMHFDHGVRALEAGKHVMIEKPMALDLAQSKHLVELAQQKTRILSVFHNRRWDIDYLSVRQHLSSGIFGKAINVESRLGQFASCVGPAAREYRPNWRNEASFGGGGLYDWGSHFVDQIWRLFWPAKPVRLFAQLRANVWSAECDDFARICIDFDSGAVGLVEINTTTLRPLPRWHIDGSQGSADSPHSPTFDLNTWAKLSFRSATGESRELPPAPDELNEPGIWDRFALACRGEGEAAVAPESVLVTMMLLDAARESSATGEVVQLSDRIERLTIPQSSLSASHPPV